jgi:hypothetical protein
MKIIRRFFRLFLLGAITSTVATQVDARELKLDVLHTKTDSYTNVTVIERSDTDVFIQHSAGLSNIKVEDLDEEGLWLVGLSDNPPQSEENAQAVVGSLDGGEAPPGLGGAVFQALMQGMAGAQRGGLEGGAFAGSNGLPQGEVQLDPKAVAIGAAILLFLYLFTCFCLKLIVDKTGERAGFLVWIPLLQIFPMLRGAGMSAWWFLAFFVPILNIVAQIVWCVKITEARGKSGWVALFLILPFTNLFAFLYLAFSSGADFDDGDNRVVIPPVFSEA